MVLGIALLSALMLGITIDKNTHYNMSKNKIILNTLLAIVLSAFLISCNNKEVQEINPKSTLLKIKLPKSWQPVDEFGVCVFPKDSPEERKLFQGEYLESENLYQLQISNLKPSTEYKYGTYAILIKNGEREVVYGNLRSFKTPEVPFKLGTTIRELAFQRATFDIEVLGLSPEMLFTESGIFLGLSPEEVKEHKWFIASPKDNVGKVRVTKQPKFFPKTQIYFQPFVVVNNDPYYGEIFSFTTHSFDEDVSMSVDVTDITDSSACVGVYIYDVISRDPIYLSDISISYVDKSQNERVVHFPSHEPFAIEGLTPGSSITLNGKLDISYYEQKFTKTFKHAFETPDYSWIYGLWFHGDYVDIPGRGSNYHTIHYQIYPDGKCYIYFDGSFEKLTNISFQGDDLIVDRGDGWVETLYMDHNKRLLGRGTRNDPHLQKQESYSR